MNRPNSRWSLVVLGAILGLPCCSTKRISPNAKFLYPQSPRFAEVSGVQVTGARSRSDLPSVIPLLTATNSESRAISNADLAAFNAWQTAFYRCVESEFYASPPDRHPCDELDSEQDPKEWPAGLPRVTVALSGGGIRSAAFSLGVLQGLADIGFLSRVDVLSTVSGGGYAASYVASRALMGDGSVSDTLVSRPATSVNEAFGCNFDSPTPPSADDPCSSPIDRIKPETFMSKFYGGLVALGAVVLKPIDWIGSLFPRDTNSPDTVYGHIAYQVALQSSFHAGKVPILSPSPPTSTLARDLRRKGVPLWVTNSTMTTASLLGCDSTREPRPFERLEQSVFEVSPLRAGNSSVGYSDYLVDMSTANAAIASASAIDRPDSRWCGLQSFFGLRTGIRFRQFLAATPALGIAGDSQAQSPRVTKRLLLTDGGHSENLAALSAIRRLSEVIIIVDAEHDPQLAFNGYARLKRYVERELGAHLDLPGVESLALESRQRLLNAAGYDSASFARSDPTCGVPDLPLEASTGGDCDSALWSLDVKRLRTRSMAGKDHAGDSIDLFQADDLPVVENVFEGELAEFPFRGRREPLRLRILYVKLAFGGAKDEDTLRLFGSSWPLQYFRQVTDCKALDCESPSVRRGESVFPQDPTSDQDYSRGHFRAYSDLGRVIVRANSQKFVTDRRGG